MSRTTNRMGALDRCRRLVLSGLVWLASLAQLMAGTPLFERGRSAWRVVVPEKAARPVRHAAEELTNTLAKISGATLPVVPAAGAPAKNVICLVQEGDAADDVFSVATAQSRSPATETAADAVEIALDTNIVVAANDALKIEYGIMVPSWRIR